MAFQFSGVLRRFRDDSRGTMSLEAVIVIPMVVFTLMLTTVFADFFRSNTTAVKASYTIADTLSRRSEPVDGTYIEGLNQLYAYLARARQETTLRVTSIAWNVPENEYQVVWSYGAEGREPLTTPQVNEHLAERLPTLPVGETVILVEADMRYVPLLPDWFDIRAFSSVIVTRPRFTSQLRFDTGDGIIFLPDGPPTCDDGGTLCEPGDV